MVSFPLYCLSPRDCLLRRHEYMFSSPLYPFRRTIVCCAPRVRVGTGSFDKTRLICLVFLTLTTIGRYP